MARIPKKVDPAVQFTCANCKRVRLNTERDATRLICADRKDCREALADWMSKTKFSVGVAEGKTA